MIASASLLATILGVLGSLAQAHFISPDDLGFVRKYSVVSSYAVFLNLGLFSILHREYPVLIGQGQPERARRTVAIVQSWCLLVSTVVCCILSIIMIAELFQGHLREASAWFIQIIAVWGTLYTEYLGCTYRSGQEFERLAKGQFLSAISGVAVVPLFWIWPFPTLVLRSVAGSILCSLYLHVVRPVKVGWCLPLQEFSTLVKRGLRLYVGTYLRYSFWLTVEIWLMLKFAGDSGVGLFVFSKMIATAGAQLSMAINQVYLPRLAQKYGQNGGNVSECLKFVVRPALLNSGISVLIICGFWLFLPPLIQYAFPHYLAAVPLIRVLVLQTILVSVSMPLYMISITENYLTQILAAIIGLAVFIGVSFALQHQIYQGVAVAWGTLAGQAAFAMVCFFGLIVSEKRRKG
ncbi:MAG: hypothetical protein JXA82_19000 [Sedimentisphaerales bacterium]|nr:hypothetical protein [Sedimentisphaerales bacterium]